MRGEKNQRNGKRGRENYASDMSSVNVYMVFSCIHKTIRVIQIFVLGVRSIKTQSEGG